MKMKDFIYRRLEVEGKLEEFKNSESFHITLTPPTPPRLVISKFQDEINILEDHDSPFVVGYNSPDNVQMSYLIKDDDWCPESVRQGNNKPTETFKEVIYSGGGVGKEYKPLVFEKAKTFERVWVNGMLERGHSYGCGSMTYRFNWKSKIRVLRRFVEFLEDMSRECHRRFS